MKVRITQGITDEYNARCVFGGFDGWPEVPDTAGIHDLPESTVRAMLADAEHFCGPDAPDEMPLSERSIYAAHAKRCRKALAQ